MMARAEKEMEELAFGGQVKVGETEPVESEKVADKIVEDMAIEKVSDDQKSDMVQDVIDDGKPALQKVISDNVDNSADIIYKIVIKETVNPISAKNDLYTTHSDLVEVNTGNGYKYLIGSFANLNEVIKFSDETVKVVYPNATIVKFRDGQIIE